MQGKVSARHGRLSEDPPSAVREEAGKLSHFFNRPRFIEITVDLRRADGPATGHRHEFVAQGRGPGLTAARGQASDKARRSITHPKERVQDLRRSPGAHTEAG